jgi:hypothetical protein
MRGIATAIVLSFWLPAGCQSNLDGTFRVIGRKNCLIIERADGEVYLVKSSKGVWNATRHGTTLTVDFGNSKKGIIEFKDGTDHALLHAPGEEREVQRVSAEACEK